MEWFTMTGKGKRNNSNCHKANLIRAYEYNIFLNPILHSHNNTLTQETYPDFQFKESQRLYAQMITHMFKTGQIFKCMDL